jgi:acyl-CoA thioester hydrolase
MGVVYHANYVVWMEVGRVEFARAAGLPYKELEAAGFFMAVIEANCRYLAPALYDDEVEIETRVEKATARGIEFGYTFWRGDKKLGEGCTRHLFLSKDLRPARLPAEYHGVFGIT